jgi:hypothetical protein
MPRNRVWRLTSSKRHVDSRRDLDLPEVSSTVATVLPSGKVLVAGGFPGTVLIFDPEDES